jgi:hypothetical protein
VTDDAGEAGRADERRDRSRVDGVNETPPPGEPLPPDDEGDPGDDVRPARPVRRGTVELRTHGGDHVRYGEAVVRYEPEAFVVAPSAAFAPERAERYQKESVAWIEVRHPRR